MNIDATFWVAISFFIFCGGLIYLKVPNKISNALNNQINEIKKELNNAEKLKVEAKNLLSDYDQVGIRIEGRLLYRSSMQFYSAS